MLLIECMTDIHQPAGTFRREADQTMKVILKNIGKISKAMVEINGITVIAGENNTGKSTISRALFSVFNSFYDIQGQMQSERTESVGYAIHRLYIDSHILPHYSQTAFQKGVDYIILNSAKYENNLDLLKKDILCLCEQWNEKVTGKISEDALEKAAEYIQNVLAIPDDVLLKFIVSNKLSSEFNGQICNIYTEKPGEICLKVKKDSLSICVSEDEVTEVNCSNEVSLHTEAIYIDDPYVVDDLQRYSFSHSKEKKDDNHRAHLLSKFAVAASGNAVDDLVAKEKLNEIYNKISSVCSGEIVEDNAGEYGYKNADSDKILKIRNLSGGLKTFAIIKRLLMNGTIENNGTIILDEPEVHLHPEWQILLAELIVLIQKEFGMHILINTHSPYFLRAIQLYSAKHSIADKCKYYLSHAKANRAEILDVTSNIEEIYAKLAKPFQKLEDDRWNDER